MERVPSRISVATQNHSCSDGQGPLQECDHQSSPQGPVSSHANYGGSGRQLALPRERRDCNSAGNPASRRYVVRRGGKCQEEHRPGVTTCSAGRQRARVSVSARVLRRTVPALAGPTAGLGVRGSSAKRRRGLGRDLDLRGHPRAHHHELTQRGAIERAGGVTPTTTPDRGSCRACGLGPSRRGPHAPSQRSRRQPGLGRSGPPKTLTLTSSTRFSEATDAAPIRPSQSR